jgi:hypothetical protein
VTIYRQTGIWRDRETNRFVDRKKRGGGRQKKRKDKVSIETVN